MSYPPIPAATPDPQPAAPAPSPAYPGGTAGTAYPGGTAGTAYPAGPGGTAYPPAPTPPRARTKPAVIAAVAVAGVVVLGGAGAFAFTKLASKGVQPDTVIPASAIAYVRVDLDPAAGQKLAAVRFLSKLPGMKSADGSSTDPRAALWKAAAGQDKDLASVDFATEIAPWLGDRAAAALLPGGTAGSPVSVVALAVTDEAKAREKIPTLLARKPANTTDVVVRSGYALFTEKGNQAPVLAALDKGTLATNPTYAADLAALGDPGIASLWVDAGEVAKLPSVSSTNGRTALGETTAGVSGRVAAAVRFDPAFVELAGITRGGPLDAAPPIVGGLATLPADTFAAVNVNGSGEFLRHQWTGLAERIDSSGTSVDEIGDAFGLRLPDDLATILGQSFTAVLPTQDFEALGRSDLPEFGIVSRGPEAARAARLLDTATYESGLSDSIGTRVVGDAMYAATTPGYLDRLSAIGGATLGSAEAFTLAVRDKQSSLSVFVDLDAIEASYLRSAPADQREALQALRAVGMSVTVDKPGETAFSLRVVGN